MRSLRTKTSFRFNIRHRPPQYVDGLGRPRNFRKVTSSDVSVPILVQKLSIMVVLGPPRTSPGPRRGRPRPSASHENQNFAVLGCSRSHPIFEFSSLDVPLDLIVLRSPDSSIKKIFFKIYSQFEVRFQQFYSSTVHCLKSRIFSNGFFEIMDSRCVRR